MATAKRRLERAEQRAGLGRDDFRERLRAATDDELLGMLHAAQLQDWRPTLSIPREELGQSRPGLATMTDAEVLEMLADARAQVQHP